MILVIFNPRPESYGSRFVVHSFYLSTALQRTAFTSSCQLRYEQAKHVDGLQSDGWILLKLTIPDKNTNLNISVS